MKKHLFISIVLLLLALALPALAEEGTPCGLSAAERYEVNVFLSNFTEQAFTSYDAQTGDAALAEFAGLHLWYNRRNAWALGSWPQGAFRLPAGELSAVCERFFGRAPANLTPLYLGYDGAYVYHDTEGPGDTRGFASVSQVEALGGGVYRAYFGGYGAGAGWDNEDCRLRPEEAARKYADFPVYTGSALFRSGSGTLGDRKDFTLLALSVE